jgi:hypothetical protein
MDSVFIELIEYDCTKISSYVGALYLYFVAYFVMAVGFQLVSLKFSRHGTMLRIIPMIAFLKCFYNYLNYNYWNQCPWPEDDSKNMVQLFKITVETLT